MTPDIIKEVRVGHLCCGSGFGAKGFRKGNARVGNLVAKFRNIGGVDVDPAGIRDFERFAGVKGTLLAWAGESFMLSSDPIWVQPLTVGLSVDVPRSFEAAE